MTVRGFVVQGADQDMAQRDPAFVAQKWAQNLGASTESIRQGVQAVTESPMEKAARNVDGWVAGVNRSRDKFQAGLRRRTLGDWQSSMIEKGIPRVSTGATAAQPKMQAFMAEFLPHVERVAQQVRSMPKGGIDNGIARATAQIRGNAQFRRSGG